MTPQQQQQLLLQQGLVKVQSISPALFREGSDRLKSEVATLIGRGFGFFAYSDQPGRLCFQVANLLHPSALPRI